MGFRDDVASRVGDAMLRRLVAMDHRCARCDRLRGIDHRRQDVIVDLEPATAFFRRRLGVGNDDGNFLADEADDVVEDTGIVRIHPVLLVPRRREQPIRRVFVGQHHLHAGNNKRRGPCRSR